MRRISLPGEFVIEGPADQIVDRHTDDELDALVITLDTSPRSEILIGLYPHIDDAVSLQTRLKSEVKRFVDNCVTRFAPIVSSRSSNPERPWLVHRVIAALADGRAWVVQGVSWPDATSWWLVHWNGPGTYLDSLVLPMFDSFQLQTKKES